MAFIDCAILVFSLHSIVESQQIFMFLFSLPELRDRLHVLARFIVKDYSARGLVPKPLPMLARVGHNSLVLFVRSMNQHDLDPVPLPSPQVVGDLSPKHP